MKIFEFLQNCVAQKSKLFVDKCSLKYAECRV